MRCARMASAPARTVQLFMYAIILTGAGSKGGSGDDEPTRSRGAHSLIGVALIAALPSLI